MRNFRLLKSSLDISSIRSELALATHWVDTRHRRDQFRYCQKIELRGAVETPGKTFHDIQETRDLPAWARFHEIRNFVTAFLAEVGGELGHVRVANLDGQAEIAPHIDKGEYWAIRDRYHLVINSPAGTEFTSGNETVIMHENELWWFDNKQLHSVKNLGQAPRTHLIFDILPYELEKYRRVAQTIV